MTTRSYSGENPMDNPLCQRLQREFRSRGVRGMQIGTRAETSVMLERVKRGLDPYENAADPNKRTVSDATRPVRPRTVQSTPRVYTVAQPTEEHHAHRAPAVAAASASVEHRRAAVPAAKERSTLRSDLRALACEHRAQLRYRRQVLHEEVQVRTPFPVAAVFMLCIFTIMALVLLLSFSQNYELEGELSSLYEEAARLEQLQRDLSVQLEERDDIRVIENIAVNQIGMVKNDLVESRFVSVSGGDRIELLETAEAEAVQSGLWSTMLSALGENFTRLREYIE